MISPVPGEMTPHGEFLANRDGGERKHAGLDLKVKGGELVRSPEPGIVVVVRKNPKKGSGYGGYGPVVVVVAGASGAYHLLSHMATVDPLAIVGAPVAEGQVVGTGSAAYGHVHWEVRSSPESRGTKNVWDPYRWLQGELVTAAESKKATPNRSMAALSPAELPPFVPVLPDDPPPAPVPPVPKLPSVGGVGWILVALFAFFVASVRRS